MWDNEAPQRQDRRSFLTTLAALGGAWAVTGCSTRAGAAVSAPSVRADRIGLQLYTVRDQMEKDFVGTLERVARIGYREVEFAGYFGHSPQEVRQLLDRLGLRSPSVHVGLELLRKDLAGEIRSAKTVGQEYLTVPALSEAFTGQKLDLAYWRSVAAELDRIGAAVSAQGLKLAYHNHWFEFDRLENGQTGYDVLLAQTDPARLKMELDLAWATFSGQDPVQMFRAHPGRFTMWHVKDIKGVAEARQQAAGAKNVTELMAAAMPRLAAVGTGEIDFKRLFAAAGAAGLEHFFVENDSAAAGGADSLANIETSFQNLKRILG